MKALIKNGYSVLTLAPKDNFSIKLEEVGCHFIPFNMEKDNPAAEIKIVSSITLSNLIKNKVFVGSNSSLVAPVTLNEKSTIGAGSVITKNVKRNSLALTRSNQSEVKNYKRKK